MFVVQDGVYFKDRRLNIGYAMRKQPSAHTQAIPLVASPSSATLYPSSGFAPVSPNHAFMPAMVAGSISTVPLLAGPACAQATYPGTLGLPQFVGTQSQFAGNALQYGMPENALDVNNSVQANALAFSNPADASTACQLHASFLGLVPPAHAFASPHPLPASFPPNDSMCLIRLIVFLMSSCFLKRLICFSSFTRSDTRL